MKNYRQRSKTVTATVPLALIVWVAGYCMTPATCPAEDAVTVNAAPAAAEQQASSAANVPVGSAGLRVYIDPVTGEFLAPPAGGVQPLGAVPVTPAMQNALSTSSDNLRVEPSTSAGGGMMVNIHGRFRSLSVAGTGKDGTPGQRCVTGDSSPPAAITPPVAE